MKPHFEIKPEHKEYLKKLENKEDVESVLHILPFEKPEIKKLLIDILKIKEEEQRIAKIKDYLKKHNENKENLYNKVMSEMERLKYYWWDLKNKIKNPQTKEWLRKEFGNEMQDLILSIYKS